VAMGQHHVTAMGEGRGGGRHVPDHAMEAYRRRRNTALLILNHSTSGGQQSTSHLEHFTSGKEPRHPLSSRLGKPHSQSGIFAEQKNFLPLPGYEPWIFQLVMSLY